MASSLGPNAWEEARVWLSEALPKHASNLLTACRIDSFVFCLQNGLILCDLLKLPVQHTNPAQAVSRLSSVHLFMFIFLNVC